MRKTLKVWLQRLRYWNFDPHVKHRSTYKGADVRCPNCHGWLSETLQENEPVFVDPPPDFGFAFQCGRCKKTSYWNCDIAPVAIQCDENGIPLQ